MTAQFQHVPMNLTVLMNEMSIMIIVKKLSAFIIWDATIYVYLYGFITTI